MPNQVVELAKQRFAALAPMFGVIEVAGKTSLSQQEIDELAYELNTAKAVKKDVVEAVDARTEEVREVFYKMADAEVGDLEPFTAYSSEHGIKMVRSISETTPSVDGKMLLDALYEHFGEEKGDTEGMAWKVWSKVSDPVYTRTLNVGKLEAELASALEHEAGIKHGSKTTYLPTAVVQKATLPAKKSARFLVPNMTKDELKAAAAGTL